MSLPFPPTLALTVDELETLREMIALHQSRGVLNRPEWVTDAVSVSYAPGVTPTSELLNKAARMINDLMIGRGIDRRNGFRWQAFVHDLYERAAAFEACEGEGKS